MDLNFHHDDTKATQELIPAVQPWKIPHSPTTTLLLESPTPRFLGVGEDLPITHEEGEERVADDLIGKSLHVELMSDTLLQLEFCFEESRGNAPLIPVQMTPENIVLIMVRRDDEQGVHGDVPLESVEIHIPEIDVGPEDQSVTTWI